MKKNILTLAVSFLFYYSYSQGVLTVSHDGFLNLDVLPSKAVSVKESVYGNGNVQFFNCKIYRDDKKDFYIQYDSSNPSKCALFPIYVSCKNNNFKYDFMEIDFPKYTRQKKLLRIQKNYSKENENLEYNGDYIYSYPNSKTIIEFVDKVDKDSLYSYSVYTLGNRNQLLSIKGYATKNKVIPTIVCDTCIFEDKIEFTYNKDKLIQIKGIVYDEKRNPTVISTQTFKYKGNRVVSSTFTQPKYTYPEKVYFEYFYH